MASKRDKSREDLYFDVLRLIQKQSEISQREIAQAVGISVGGAHYVLAALLERDLITYSKFTSFPDKRRYAYLLTSKGKTEGALIALAVLKRKISQFEALAKEIETLKMELQSHTKQTNAMSAE